MTHFRQGLRTTYRRNNHRAYALVLNAELFGGGIGQIHFSFAWERASVIDAHDHGTIIPGVGDFGIG